MLRSPATVAGYPTPLELSIMKTVLAMFVALVMFAPVAPAQSPKTSLEIRCPATLPSQRDVSVVLGMTNFSQTYAARERLMQYAQRACRRGYEGIRVIAGAANSRPSRNVRKLTAIK